MANKYHRIYLEITNICNKKCDFCIGTSRIKQFVKPEVFEQRLLKVKPWAEMVYLHVLGEPLLHPDFEKIGGICDANQTPFKLTTNGTLLDENFSGLLNFKFLRQVNISLHALNDSEVIEFERIMEFCRQALKNRPELYINLRLWNLALGAPIPEKNLRLIRRIFAALALDFSTFDYKFSLSGKGFALGGRLFLNFDTCFNWPEIPDNQPELEPQSGFCYGLKNQAAVLVGGEVVPCCLDAQGIINLGNLDEAETLAEILDAPRAVRIRQNFAAKMAVEQLCLNCTFKNRFKI